MSETPVGDDNPLVNPLGVTARGDAFQGTGNEGGTMAADKTTHPGDDTVEQQYHTGSAQPWRDRTPASGTT